MHGLIIFCNKYHPTCIFVETMDDPWTLDTIDYGRIFIFFIINSYSESFEMIEKCIDERPLSSFFPRSRMGIDTSIFIDDRKVIILEYDIEWHILCEEFHSFYFPSNFDHISPIYFFVFCEVFSIGNNISLFDHFLEIASRFFGKKSRQVSVDSPSLSWICENAEKRCCIII